MFFEKSVINDKNNQVIATIFDKDQNDFYDEIHYVNRNGEKEIIYISAYDKILSRVFK